MDRMTKHHAWRYEARPRFAFEPRLELLEERLPLGDSLGMFLTMLTGANLVLPENSVLTERLVPAVAQLAAADTLLAPRAGESATLQHMPPGETPRVSAGEIRSGDHNDLLARSADTPSWDWSEGPWASTGLEARSQPRLRGTKVRSGAAPVDSPYRPGGAPAGVVGLLRESAAGSRIIVTQPFASDLATPRLHQAALEGMTLRPEQVAASRPQADARLAPEHIHDHSHDDGHVHGAPSAQPGDKPEGPGVRHDNDAFVAIIPPFDGTWDRWSVSHPRSHWTPWNGDWSLDYYAGSGTDVIFDMADWYYGGEAFGQVIRISPACASGIIADGGWAVTIDVYSSQGDRLGWVLYAHLTGPFVSQGQWISPGQNLGQLARWRQTPCYNVSGEGGVHVHVEVYNYTHYACYSDWGSGTYLERWWAWLGGLGDHFAYGPRVACGW